MTTPVARGAARLVARVRRRGLVALIAVAAGCVRLGGAEPTACETLTYESDGQLVPATLCRPADARGLTPAIVYLHGVGGPDEMPRGLVRRLTEAGFSVFAPSYFALTPAPGPNPRSFLRAYLDGLDAPYSEAAGVWPRVIADGTAFLRRQPGVDPARIGVVGYSLGGAMALHIASSDSDYRAAATLAGFVELDGFPQLSRVVGGGFEAGAMRTPPLLMVHGRRDLQAPIAQVDRVAAVTGAIGRPIETAIFDGDHFPRGGQQAWIAQRMVEFFQRQLGAAQPAGE